MMYLFQVFPHAFLWTAGLVLFGFAEAPASSDASSARDPVVSPFDIPATDVETALKAFSAQSNCQVLIPSSAAEGVKTQPVKGQFTARAALERMLSGTPLNFTSKSGEGPFAVVDRASVKVRRVSRNAGALIVVGLATDEAQAARFWRQAEAVREALGASGVPRSAVKILPADRASSVRREEILSGARALPVGVEESWFVLLGNCAATRDGRPAFQISGPRFTCDDLKETAGFLPGKAFVVLGTSRGGGFLESLLPLSHVEAVAATSASGEINEPRFMDAWAAVLAAKPELSFHDTAVRAAQRIEAFYRDRALAQVEHAQLLDRAQGKIVPVRSDVQAGPASP